MMILEVCSRITTLLPPRSSDHVHGRQTKRFNLAILLNTSSQAGICSLPFIQVSLGTLHSYSRRLHAGHRYSIHTTGSLFAGFTFEVRRNWGQAITDQTFRSILFGEVPEDCVALPESTAPITNFMLDNEAKSPLELALLT